MKALLQHFPLAGRTGLAVRTAVILAAVQLLTAASCRPTYGTHVDSLPSLRITENSWLVADKIKVAKIIKTRVNGFLQVQIDALNISMHDYQFEYRFRWLSPDGIELEQGWANFQTSYSTAHEPLHFQAVAPNSQATDFEFLVRFPDRK